MNLLSVSENKIICEEGETKMINFLEKEHGFDVIKVPFRNVFEFGGSLHCSTWDVRRTGTKKNYFENRANCSVDVGLNAVIDRSVGQNIGLPIEPDERVHPTKRARKSV